MSSNSIGSIWRRWEPHIHTPGTALNNQFGPTTVDQYCAAVEACSPKIEALGITDYYSVQNYEEIVQAKAKGLLSSIDFIFPNVELRLDVGTVKGSAINAHLLFCPDDADHIDQIKRLLSRLKFRYGGNEYVCSKDDLIRLGKAAKATQDSVAAYIEGVLQFKVDIHGLVDEIAKNDWARDNCLIAVAAAEGDGTSGLRTQDGSFAALRQAIESQAHLIFSGNQNDRIFWLGKGSASEDHLRDKYNGLKPCIHGCDAHDLSRVGVPDLDRFCWIKGDASFESLRQACIEPESRCYIGSSHPTGSLPNHTIQSVSVSNAPWMDPSQVPINGGLVAIIGARGSGKTALADLIASGGMAPVGIDNARSFVARAQDFLQASESSLTWVSGVTSTRDLQNAVWSEPDSPPEVQYLSQQFVDELCSSEGISDALVSEIKRVIFAAHPIDEREGADNFEELKEVRCQASQEGRSRCVTELESVAAALLSERSLKQGKEALTKRKEDIEKQIKKDEEDRKKLVRPGQEERVKRHEEIGEALRQRRQILEQKQKSARAIRGLIADIDDFEARRAPAYVDELKANRADANLTDNEWLLFLPKLDSNAKTSMITKAEALEREGFDILGKQVPDVTDENLNNPLLQKSDDLSKVTISILNAELNRLSRLVGIDTANSKAYKVLSDKIDAQKKQLENLAKEITRATQADQKIKDLLIRRKDAYRAVFDFISQLENELRKLYEPLANNLAGSQGALGKLSFVVRRRVNLSAWARRGEALLDLRKEGPFRGQGELLKVARSYLYDAWQKGASDEVGDALAKFMQEKADDVKAHKLDSMESKDWNTAISTWLHSTDHIQVDYGIEYDGVEVERLSPGTRGIVLLLLYLAIDRTDDRPLIIDQPEENLDPQSVFDELVPRFREARLRRQIIIVTHNANLVVNTDSDQVIIANAGSHTAGGLPTISYTSGGLEVEIIREAVCNILEGGKRAFEARAKRLRLT
ncbi:MAG: AAA family ATPase [Armatimonadetes bacterium]|nr:AAA family ATPase [Armatimonadota bacterium]